MKMVFLCRPLVLTLIWIGWSATASAVTYQSPSHLFDGSRPYLYVEAERFSALNDGDNNGWKIVSKASPIVSPSGVNILPASSNVYGTALINDIGGLATQSVLADKATYEVSFVTAGTYQLYTRHTLFDSALTPGNFSNEDSIYMSPGFNKNSSSDWNGFEGFEFNEQNVEVDIPDPSSPVDLDGFEPGTAISKNSGWLELRDWAVKSDGVVTNDNNANNSFWNGNFYWYNRPFYRTGNDTTGAFLDDFGFKTQFIVTPEMVGQTVTFEVGAREDYAVIDGYLFIQDDSLNLLDLYSQQEVDAALVPYGDLDDDRDLDLADYLILSANLLTDVSLLTTAQAYLLGDLTADLRIDGRDFVAFLQAFQDYNGFPFVAVPEPSAGALAALGCGAIFLRRRPLRKVLPRSQEASDSRFPSH